MTIAIAISGGIDSLVAAHLVGQSGEDAFGLHFLTGYENIPLPAIAEKIRRISEQIQIPVHIVDLSQSFRKKVVKYFTQTYLAGKTPNPCLVCNATIKFDDLLSEARRLGADRLATGHYAGSSKIPAHGACFTRAPMRKRISPIFWPFSRNPSCAGHVSPCRT
jgi:tRNA-specific 2-thiouridylase